MSAENVSACTIGFLLDSYLDFLQELSVVDVIVFNEPHRLFT